jgi:lipid-binding SYLF domain-containing protein
MKSSPTTLRLLAASIALLCATTGGLAAAQTSSASTGKAVHNPGEVKNATDTVNKAVQVVHVMESDPSVAAHLKSAKGVYVIPNYGRGAFVIGGRGGAGVLLVQQAGTWSNPAFYSMGGGSIGIEAGGEGGSMAFILNNQKAIDSFTQNNKFSLNADAGLTIVDWSKKGMGDAGWGDITAWANTKGLFGGADISITGISYDQKKTSAYYGQQVASRDVLAGKVANPQADALKQALANAGGTGSAAATGSSGATGTSTGSGTATPPSDKHR